MTIKGEFYVPIYDAFVKIIVADNLLRSINYHLTKHGHKKEEKSPGGYFFYPHYEHGTYYLFFCKNTLTVNAVNHEKSHLIDQILIDRSIKPKDEVRAYLDGFVSNKVDLFFKRRKSKLKISN
jgi:hypothetical protein